ncbi:MAG: hypothetical protein US49_C0005G0093 [candidate division TM6 bacterium GW2011_GWF2_37_49]|nr:MAG: hypothetical protein US49_C0005G0093 [candidate division TM6 bacterium GW2011_GWF2_37_49]
MNLKTVFFLMATCLVSQNISAMTLNLPNIECDQEIGAEHIKGFIKIVGQEQFIVQLQNELSGENPYPMSVFWLSDLIYELSDKIFSAQYLPFIYLEKLTLRTDIKCPKQMIFNANDKLFAFLDLETNFTYIFETSTFECTGTVDCITREYYLTIEDNGTIGVCHESIENRIATPISFRGDDMPLVIPSTNNSTMKYGPGKSFLAVYSPTQVEANIGNLIIYERVSDPIKIVLILALKGLCDFSDQNRVFKKQIIQKLFNRIPELATTWKSFSDFEQAKICECFDFDNPISSYATWDYCILL